jgi:hypothetical protein
VCLSGVSWSHYPYTASSPGSQWNAGLIGVPGVDAASTNAAFYTPLGVAGDAYGNVYVADTLDSLVRKISRNTSVSAPTSGPGAYTISPLVGQVGAYGTCVSGTSGDGGAATSSALVNPVAVAVDVTGNVFFIDCGGPVQVSQGSLQYIVPSSSFPSFLRRLLAQVTSGTQWGNTVCPHSVVRAVLAAPGPTPAPTRAPTVHPTPTPTAAPSTFKVQYLSICRRCLMGTLL